MMKIKFTILLSLLFLVCATAQDRSFSNNLATEVSNGIDTLSNYQSLMEYTGNSKVIYINHEKYYGLFRRSTTGDHNRITVVESLDGQKWKRDIDGKNYYTRWVEVDESLDAVGVASSDWKAVHKISQIAPLHSRIHLQPQKKYLVDRVIDLSGKELVGTFDTLFVPDQHTTTATASFNNTNIIEVVDASGFKAFETIGFANNGGKSNTDLIATATGTKRVRINSILGNTLYLDQSITSIDANDIIFNSNDIIQAQSSKLTIRDIVFDGNITNNSANYGWETGACIRSNQETIIENCTFIKVINTVFLPSGYIDNCVIDSSAGASIAHISSSAIDDLNLRRTVTVKNCRGYNLGLFYDESEHQESFVTMSASVYNLKLKDNYIRNSQGGLLMPFSSDDWHLIIDGNEIYNSAIKVRQAISLNTITGNSYNSDIYIRNNTLINSGNIEILGGSYNQGNGVYRVAIENNTVKNGLVFLQNNYGGKVEGNFIFLDSTFDYSKRQIGGLTNLQAHALLLMKSCAEVLVSNNQFFSTQTFGDEVFQGIALVAPKAITIADNKIKGFQVGINCYNNSAEGTTPHYVYIQSNEIKVSDDPNCTLQANAACVIAGKGNTIKKNLLIADIATGNSRCILTRINSNNDPSVTTIEGNTLFTNSNVAVYTVIGGNDVDEMIIANNSGISSDPSVFIHPDYLAGTNSLINNNNALDSDSVNIPSVSLPAFLNFSEE